MINDPKFMSTDEGKPYIKVDIGDDEHFSPAEGIARMIGRLGEAGMTLTLIPIGRSHKGEGPSNFGKYLICFEKDKGAVEAYEGYHEESRQERFAENRALFERKGLR